MASLITQAHHCLHNCLFRHRKNIMKTSCSCRLDVQKHWAQWNAAMVLYHVGHDDAIKWKLFPRHWPFVRGIHRSPVNSPHKGQSRGALMFSLICARINDWVNNREAGDLRRHRGHYDVSVMPENDLIDTANCHYGPSNTHSDSMSSYWGYLAATQKGYTPVYSDKEWSRCRTPRTRGNVLVGRHEYTGKYKCLYFRRPLVSVVIVGIFFNRHSLQTTDICRYMHEDNCPW